MQPLNRNWSRIETGLGLSRKSRNWKNGTVKAVKRFPNAYHAYFIVPRIQSPFLSWSPKIASTFCCDHCRSGRRNA